MTLDKQFFALGLLVHIGGEVGENSRKTLSFPLKPLFLSNLQ
jgi:hypothetical protein